MQHFIWVFTVCHFPVLGFSVFKQVKIRKHVTCPQGTARGLATRKYCLACLRSMRLFIHCTQHSGRAEKYLNNILTMKDNNMSKKSGISGLDKDLDQWVFQPLLFNLMSILLHI